MDPFDYFNPVHVYMRGFHFKMVVAFEISDLGRLCPAVRILVIAIHNLGIVCGIDVFLHSNFWDTN